MSDHPTDPAPKRTRRQRYAGTHPKRYAERYKELAADRYPEILDRVRARGDTPAGRHVSVLLEESIGALALAPGAVVADCTLGFGGHSQAILDRIGAGRLFGLDVDARALRAAAERFGDDRRFQAVRSSFAGLGRVMADVGIEGFDAVLADLGVSSMQIDDPERGFSFREPGPLDMRLDDRKSRTAADLVATLGAAELGAILARNADEPAAAAIAAAIVRERERRPIVTTKDLTAIVFAAKGLSPKTWREASGQGKRAAHPAVRTFQALRIEVNDELGALKELLRTLPWCLKPGGRAALISFHSGEDRLIDEALKCGVAAGLYVEASGAPIVPTPTEIFRNPRSRSAKLRVAVRARG